jgi:hypothetical protein
LLGAALFCVVLGILFLAGTVLLYKKTRPRSLDVPSIEKPTPTGPVLITWNGVDFREGSLVRVKSWAGVAEPGETGLDISLSIEAGRLGTVIAATNIVTEYNRQIAGGETRVLVVRWFKQDWSCLPQFWRSRRVEPFQSSINADYLAVEN